MNRLLSSGSGVWSVAPALGLTLFDAGATTARIEQADARREQAALTYLSTARTAVEEAEAALYAVDRQQRRLPDLAAVLEADRTALTLAWDRYRAGLTDFLDVADADPRAGAGGAGHPRHHPVPGAGRRLGSAGGRGTGRDGERRSAAGSFDPVKKCKEAARQNLPGFARPPTRAGGW